MKLTKFISVFMLGFPLLVVAQSKNVNEYHVPFYNVSVSTGEQISADYQFNPEHQVLVCASTSLASPIISWNHNGSLYSAILPAGGHVSLKNHRYPEGYFADNKGLIKIDNSNFKSGNNELLVSCEYHTWG